MERTQLIIVRHGETQWNIANIRQGHLDSELTDIGIAQAKALAQRLLRERFSALYSSDLSRAHDTARAVAGHTGHRITVDPRLQERRFGIFEGLLASDSAPRSRRRAGPRRCRSGAPATAGPP